MREFLDSSRISASFTRNDINKENTAASRSFCPRRRAAALCRAPKSNHARSNRIRQRAPALGRARHAACVHVASRDYEKSAGMRFVLLVRAGGSAWRGSVGPRCAAPSPSLSGCAGEGLEFRPAAGRPAACSIGGRRAARSRIPPGPLLQPQRQAGRGEAAAHHQRRDHRHVPVRQQRPREPVIPGSRQQRRRAGRWAARDQHVGGTRGSVRARLDDGACAGAAPRCHAARGGPAHRRQQTPANSPRQPPGLQRTPRCGAVDLHPPRPILLHGRQRRLQAAGRGSSSAASRRARLSKTAAAGRTRRSVGAAAHTPGRAPKPDPRIMPCQHVQHGPSAHTVRPSAGGIVRAGSQQ